MNFNKICGGFKSYMEKPHKPYVRKASLWYNIIESCNFLAS
jgi:hypothetical protein